MVDMDVNDRFQLPFSTPPHCLQTPYSNLFTMGLRLGDIAPDFEAETTKGPIKFHEWIGNSWVSTYHYRSARFGDLIMASSFPAWLAYVNRVSSSRLYA